MKKILFSSVTALTLLSSVATASDKYNGFSYIGFGVETATYQEIGVTKEGKAFKSSATSSSPVYISGSLININNNFDFTIDASSTLMATTTDEKWQEDGYLVQANKFDSVQSDLKFLLHYKMNNNHRIAFGPNYNMFSMKRHTYTNPADGSEKLDNGDSIGLNQEDIATLNMMLGYWYESKPFSNGGMRVSVSALYGMPIWNKATNTSTAEIEFSSTDGSTINLNGYLGFELTKGLEMGAFVGYSIKDKSSTDKVQVNASSITWPENELETVRYGISFVWNFDAK